MNRLADLLTILRLGIAMCLPGALGREGVSALVLVAVAAVTDYVDGPVARRSGHPSRWGGVLDNTADIAIVLGGAAAAAWLGRISWVVPSAIVVSVLAYAIDSARLSRRVRAPRLAASRVGHAAGVANWAVVGVVAAGCAWPAVAATPLANATGLGVAMLNLAAVVMRLLPRRALGSPAAET